MNSKKGVAINYIILIVFALVSLIVLLFVLSQFHTSYVDNAHIYECKETITLLDNPVTRTTFFQGDLLSQKGIDFIRESCPYEEVEVKKNIDVVSDLMLNCWKKFNSGQDFIPASKSGEVLCIHCGTLLAQEEISEFEEDLKKVLREEKYNSELNNENSEVLNMNTLSLYTEGNLEWVPDSISSLEQYGIFYLIGKPQITCSLAGRELTACPLHLLDYTVDQFAQSSPMFSYLEKYIGPSRESFGGVFMKELINDEEVLNTEILEINSEQGTSVKCSQLISPPPYES